MFYSVELYQLHTQKHSAVYPLSPYADQLDVLLFQSFLLRKRSGPSTIPEGSQSVYSVVLDGPPASDISLELEAADNFARLEE